MERGPLPPHERSWRHPSEVAADTRQAIRTERPSQSVRNTAIIGGTATILLVGAVVLALSPSTAPNPTVAGSSPVEPGVTTAALTTAPPPGPSLSDPAPADPPAAAPAHRPVAIAAAGGTGVVHADAPLAIGLGDGVLAVLPSQSVVEMLDRHDTRPRSALTVALHDGSITTAAVLHAGDGQGLAVVRIDRGPLTTTGFEMASDMPADHETVTVMTADPIDVAVHRLDDVNLSTESVADGAAVLDSHGHLVGLLTDTDGDGARLLPVHHTLDDVIDTTIDDGMIDDATIDRFGDVSDGDADDAATARD